MFLFHFIFLKHWVLIKSHECLAALKKITMEIFGFKEAILRQRTHRSL